MTLNDINVLHWYDNLSDQNHRKWWAYDRIYPLITPAERLLPFQMNRDATNEPITEFTLIDFNTGVETDILSGMESAGLNVYNNGIENYDTTGLSEQNLGTTVTTSWGWSFAPANTRFDYLQVKLSLYEVTNIPQYFRAVIKDGKDGATLATSNDLDIGAVIPSVQTLTFAFDEIIDYATSSAAMWVEIRADGEFYPYGKDGVTLDFTSEQERYGAAGDLTTAPTVNTGTPGDYDAYTRVWGGVYDYDIVCYPGILSHGTATPEGRYYARMADANNTWYSEVFTIVNDVTNYLKIEYWHRYDFIYDNGHIKYNNPVAYKSTLYLDTDIGKPKYLFEDKVSERNGAKLKIHQVSIKAFVFECFTPEYLLDAMRVIRMHHDVVITDRNGQEYIVDDFIITPNWQKDGDIAVTECEFRTNTIIVQNGDNVSPLPESTGLGQWQAPNGDFWQTPSGDGWIYS